MHYYKWDIAAHIAKTSHLDEMEDLAYRRMLDFYYLNEKPLPVDINILAKKIRMRQQCTCIEYVLQEFYALTDDGYVMDCVQDEIEEYQDLSNQRSAAAKARWEKEKLKQARKERLKKEKEQKTNKSDASALQEDSNLTDAAIQTDEVSNANKELRTKNKELGIRNQYKDQIQSVFDYWVQAMGKTGQTKLTIERKKKIRDRLASGYTVLQIQEAIYNCSQSPHNMGFNDRNTQYNDLTLICRDDTKLEYYLNSVNKNQQAQMSSSTQQTLNNLNNMELT